MSGTTVHHGPPVTNSPYPTPYPQQASYPQQAPSYQPPPNQVAGGGWNSGVLNQGFSSPPAYSETKQ